MLNTISIPFITPTSHVFIFKQELAGRTMDFSFDISQTPLIGRRILLKSETGATHGGRNEHQHVGTLGSPRRSASLSPADAAQMSGWKRPWMSQGRVRECLVSLLTTCGQRVGLPKSPSVILIWPLAYFAFCLFCICMIQLTT